MKSYSHPRSMTPKNKYNKTSIVGDIYSVYLSSVLSLGHPLDALGTKLKREMQQEVRAPNIFLQTTCI